MFETNPLFATSFSLSVCFLILLAVVCAFTAKSVAVRAGSWGVVYACWIANALLENGPAFTRIVSLIVFFLPLVLFVPASWRLPRGRGDALTAEIGLLLLILAQHWVVKLVYTYDFTGEVAPVGLLVYFLLLAAVFAAAAILGRGRRFVYGAVALACVLLGVFREVLLWSVTGQHPDVPFNDDYLVAAVYVGIPALGLLAQILWWRRGASKAGIVSSSEDTE
jgi:hypothetical protein